MAMFACWSTLLVRRKKKSNRFSNVADGNKKGSSNGDLRVKPINPVSPSTENGIKAHSLTVSKSFLSVKEKTLSIPKVLSDDSLARPESTGDAAYEAGDEHEMVLSTKKECSHLTLQPKGELVSHGPNTDLTNYVFEKMETDKEIETKIGSGHVSDPGMERTAFLESPVLKRSCSNIETKLAKQRFKSPIRSSSYSNLQDQTGKATVEITYENHHSPLSVRSSCSADHVMLKRRSSSQVLPSRSRKIWWKLFLWSHRNLHKPRAPQRQISILSAPVQKEGYSSDTFEPGHKLDKHNWKAAQPENQWVAFSVGSSRMDRVNAWINSLEDCSFLPVNVDETDDGIEDEQIAELHHLENEEASEKVCSHTCRREAEDVAQANSIIQSLNTFSSVAHISVHITSGCLPKSLHTLDLSRNKISTIEGFRDLEKLRVVNLSYNRITKIGHGLSSCTVIRELYLAGNKISNVEGLHRLLKLTVLDLSFNKITTSKALGQLVANYNSLLALNLLGNPIQTNIGDEQLRKAVVSLLPHVTYLNKQVIKPHRMREVATKSVAKAALGDVARCSRRKLTRRLSQGSGSSTKSRVCGKGRHSSSGRK
ncbi:uncharacterized protein LOC110033421 isoform X2 [Phalaenopsis equestris]|uniref:uncharacterized protein LOC110033421 isoform X2 n=1 Tax=Phalaenopsis equestris TaxID=78828 RepID=UPI0009E5A3AA|nr:uncharacterized protein LOC110033421 isoform X2 [Phalaenopsis equestris]